MDIQGEFSNDKHQLYSYCEVGLEKKKKSFILEIHHFHTTFFS